jgi:hypothetical protein
MDGDLYHRLRDVMHRERWHWLAAEPGPRRMPNESPVLGVHGDPLRFLLMQRERAGSAVPNQKAEAGAR